jgi:nucleoside-diphosphate-sugar epimerase
MKVALTGATGFVGSHVLADLQEHGHEVTALVRDDAQAKTVAARGATPNVVELYDRTAVAGLFRNADGAVHTASPGDATSADLDNAVVDAAVDAFAGTGKPFIEISGLWVYGDNTAISEESPFNAPALVAWKEPIERRVLGASGIRGAVVVSGVAYGDGGGGIPGLVLGSPRDDAGNLIMLGTGQQHWATVHAADLADVFRRVLENGSARGYYVVGNGMRSTVAELTEAAAVAAGAPGAVAGSDEEARARLGDYFAEVLLLDQATEAAKARAELGWSPAHPSLVEEFRQGSYRK